MVQSKIKPVEKLGDLLVEVFHLLFLFVIGAAICWSAAAELFILWTHHHPTLKDILLLFIYLELVAMVGIYFKTHKLPVRFLIYIAITAVTRYLVVEIKSMDWDLVVGLSVAILILTGAVFVLRYNSERFSRDHLGD
ncbi:MAG: phosphate-starvation-inducible protein PsiE [Gammaproteobacteria bacterium]